MTIRSIDYDSGIITLSDRSRWEVSPGDLTTIVTWLPRHRVELRGAGTTRELVNNDHGTTVGVMRAS
jgi:hypothetical protein